MCLNPGFLGGINPEIAPMWMTAAPVAIVWLTFLWINKKALLVPAVL